MDVKNKDYLIITTAAFHKGLRQQVLAELSYPENYRDRIRIKVKYLKNCKEIFNLIKSNKNQLKEYECIYLFVNLHKDPHGYVPLRYCKIIDVILPKKEFADNDFVEFIIEFGQYICLKNGEETQKKLETYLHNFIEGKGYNYQDKNCKRVKDKDSNRPKEIRKKENTIVFNMPRKIINKYLDVSGEKSTSKRWREIIEYLSYDVQIQFANFYNKNYPCRKKKPADFSRCLFYRWDIYNALSGNPVKRTSDNFILDTDALYEIKFETYVPKFNNRKYEARKTAITFKEEGCISPISGNEVIFSFSQVADQQVFSFKTTRGLLKQKDIIRIKSAIEENLIFEPDFKINITVKKYWPFVIAKIASAIISAGLLGCVLIYEKDISPLAMILFSIGTFLPIVIPIVELLIGKVPD